MSDLDAQAAQLDLEIREKEDDIKGLQAGAGLLYWYLIWLARRVFVVLPPLLPVLRCRCRWCHRSC